MMKHLMLSALLASLLLASVSCGEAAVSGTTAETAGDTVTVTDAVTEETDSAETREALNLPDADYGGYEFRILEYEKCNNIQYYDFDWSEDSAGELINDAVQKRNFAIEETYNVKIKAENVTDPVSKAKNIITAGDDAYDVMELYINNAATYGLQGMFVNWYDIPHVSLDKAWWDTAIQRDLALYNQMYVMTGDISIYDEELNYCVYFNKEVMQKYDVPNLYDIVKNNEWTLDKLENLGKDVSMDVNGDGVRNEEDSFGVLTDGGMLWLFYFTSGCTYITLDSDRVPQISVDERSATVVDRLVTFFNDTDTVLWAGKCSNQWTTLDKVFMEDRALFRPGSIYDIIYYRNMNADFGILPYPKFDEQQKDYYHIIATQACPGLVVPTTNTDIDRTGLLLEALAYASRDTVTAAYYDVNLYSKLARDNDSGEMLDIIFSTKRYDAGFTFDWGGITGTLQSIASSKNSFATQWEKKRSSVEKAMVKTIASYEENMQS